MIREKTRKPCVAGTFYDASPEDLKDNIETLLKCYKPEKLPGKVQAVIVPHAGYIFSGTTAAKTFKTAQTNDKYKLAIILAPSHCCPFSGIAYSTFSRYKTPLGDVEIDRRTLENIISAGNQWINRMDIAHEDEHSIEVELPFLQVLFPGMPILPFVCGRIDRNIATSIVSTLSGFFREDILWIISSDFTHYGTPFRYVPFDDNIQENLKKLDSFAAERIISLDYDGFSDHLKRTGATICGANPIKILIKALKQSVDKGMPISGKMIEYTSSGELTGDWSHCVDYIGIVFYRHETLHSY